MRCTPPPAIEKSSKALYQKVARSADAVLERMIAHSEKVHGQSTGACGMKLACLCFLFELRMLR